MKCRADHEEKDYLTILSYITLFFSTFLIVAFVVYAMLPKMRNIHGVIVMCYLASLAVYYIVNSLINIDKAGRSDVSLEFWCILCKFKYIFPYQSLVISSLNNNSLFVNIYDKIYPATILSMQHFLGSTFSFSTFGEPLDILGE